MDWQKTTRSYFLQEWEWEWVSDTEPEQSSMIGDYFPKEKRGKALGLFNIGVSVGSGIAFIIGGQIIAYVASRDNLILPIIGEIYPWQALFIMVGLPGLIVAALMMTSQRARTKRKDCTQQ